MFNTVNYVAKAPAFSSINMSRTDYANRGEFEDYAGLNPEACNDIKVKDDPGLGDRVIVTYKSLETERDLVEAMGSKGSDAWIV